MNNFRFPASGAKERFNWKNADVSNFEIMATQFKLKKFCYINLVQSSKYQSRFCHPNPKVAARHVFSCVCLSVHMMRWEWTTKATWDSTPSQTKPHSTLLSYKSCLVGPRLIGCLICFYNFYILCLQFQIISSARSDNYRTRNFHTF